MGCIPIYEHKVLSGRELAIPVKYRTEIEEEILGINIKRDIVLSCALAFVVITILTISMLSLYTQAGSIYVSLSSYRVHLLLLIISVAFIVYVSASKAFDLNNVFALGFAHQFLNLAVLTLCSIIAIDNELVGQRPISYITAMFCIGSVVLMPTATRLKIFLIPWGIYQIRMLIIIQDNLVIFQNFVFVTLLMILSMLFSHINYSAYISNFNNRKIIEEKLELDRLYKTSEANLQRSNEELKQTLEMEQLRTAFFANLSHELRTPLNIVFSAEYMLDRTLKSLPAHEKQKEVDRYLKMMRKNSYRLLRIIDNLLDTTKIDMCDLQLNRKYLNIVKLIEIITASVSSYIKDRNIKITFGTEMDEKLIMIDPDIIERIVLNLLSNSVKFTPEGGSISVRLSRIDNNTVLSVRDTGIGIPDEMTAAVFERFNKVDKTYTRDREGSGLGLSLVKSLVELHGGSISVSSKLGEGSEFVITLPEVEAVGDNECGYDLSLRVSNIEEKVMIEFSDIYD